jgi:hypothetical protein
MEVIYEMPPENEIPKTLDTNLSEDDLEMNVKDDKTNIIAKTDKVIPVDKKVATGSKKPSLEKVIGKEDKKDQVEVSDVKTTSKLMKDLKFPSL